MKARPFTDADFATFQDFAQEHFGQSHCRRLDFNRHWFHSPWAGEWSARMLEHDDGRMAGLFMLIVVPARFKGQPTRLAWISSGAVDEEAQAVGAGTQLYLWAYRGTPLTGALNGNENSDPINAVLGQAVPGAQLRRFICVHRQEAADLCRPEHRDHIAASVRALPPTSGLTVESGEVLPADVGALWERFRQRFDFVVDRTPEYLEWRYLQAPFVRYRFLSVRDGGQLVGFAVTRMQTTPVGKVCRIVDFMADDPWAGAVWACVARTAAEEGALVSDFIVIGDCQDQYLPAGNFFPADAASGLDAVPSLLSPIEYRHWNPSAFFGGALSKTDQSWRRPGGIWVTKGDSDRDWPTSHDLNQMALPEQ